jgi:hypothetical protein
MDDIKYYAVVHADNTASFYNADGQEIDEPNDVTDENVKVLYDAEYVAN